MNCNSDRTAQAIESLMTGGTAQEDVPAFHQEISYAWCSGVMPGVACLYRCVGGFVIPDLPTPIISGLRRTAERSPAAKRPHHARFLPDAVGADRFHFPDIFHRVFICHDFGVGEIVHK